MAIKVGVKWQASLQIEPKSWSYWVMRKKIMCKMNGMWLMAKARGYQIKNLGFVCWGPFWSKALFVVRPLTLMEQMTVMRNEAIIKPAWMYAKVSKPWLWLNWILHKLSVLKMSEFGSLFLRRSLEYVRKARKVICSYIEGSPAERIRINKNDLRTNLFAWTCS